MLGRGRKHAVVFFAIECMALTVSALGGSNYTDAEALLAVKAALGNPSQLSAWSDSSHVCTWMVDNIHCNSDNRVNYLRLMNDGKIPLTGTLSPYIGNLTELTVLDLSFNKISGTIPPEIGRLVKLTQFYLGYNSFTGDIPKELGNLILATEFTVDDCKLNGRVPPELGNLTSVRKLDLSRNNFNSTVPKEIGNLISLRELYMSAGTFTGEIPAELGNLPFIDKLELSSNSFTGVVPASFVKLADKVPRLTFLNVSYNHLSGYLPPQLGKINLFNYEGQSGGGAFCSAKGAYTSILDCPPDPKSPLPSPTDSPVSVGSPPDASKNATGSGILVGAICGGLGALGSALLIVYLLVKAKRAKQALKKRKDPQANGRVLQYSFEELRAATNNWTMLLGRGGFGPVYKGVMQNGTLVAIKRLRTESSQGKPEFQNEIDLLSRLHHRCLVNLVGWCDQDNESILVYEYKSRGSLDTLLRPQDLTVPVLPWSTRMCIAVDVAEALEYLHHGADPPVIHRDIKTANVLVDALYNGSLADFGLGKLDESNDTHVSTHVKGTFGYLDPEYVMLQKLTTSSDVYAYGVVLLELISGMKAFDPLRGSEKAGGNPSPAVLANTTAVGERGNKGWSTSGGFSGASSTSASSVLDTSPSLDAMDSTSHTLLSLHSKHYLMDESLTKHLVDPRLQGDFNSNDLKAAARVAIACLQSSAKDRPSMRDICRMLPQRPRQRQRPSENAQTDATIPQPSSGTSWSGSSTKRPSKVWLESSSSSHGQSSSYDNTSTAVSQDWSSWMRRHNKHES